MTLTSIARKAQLTALALGLAAGPSIVTAQEQVDVRFEPGASSTTVNGTIVGDEYIDYVLGARAGQTLVASLEVTATNGNGSVFFNVLPAGQDYPALYNGSTDDDRRAAVTLPESGDWAIRLYLMGNDRDAGKTVGYSLDVSIPPGGRSHGADASGGDDTARVTGVPADDVLNVRSGPGTEHGIVGALGDGDRVRLLGCESVGRSQWCEIEMMTDMRERGWVNARYLTGASTPQSGSSSGVPSAAEQACLRDVTNVTNNPDVVLLGSDAYQGGGRYVRVGVGPDRAVWQCIGYPDGRTAEIMSLTDEGRY